MKNINIAITILMALGLAACGSSGGNNTTSVTQTTQPSVLDTKPPVTDTQQPKSPPPEQPEFIAKTDLGVTIDKTAAENNDFNKQYPFTGAGFTVPKTPGEVLITTRYNEKSANETDLRVLRLDDKTLEIFPSTTAKIITLTSDNMTRIAVQGENVTTAFITDTDTPFYYSIVNAINPTKDTTALSGTFNYSGTGYHSYAKDGAQNPNTVTDSVVKLTADFDNKFVKGSISSPENEFKTLEVGGYITNNGFQGKVNQTELIGGFFGSQAQEAAGYYLNRDKQDPSYGVFNTSKQAQ